jgi:hypothetical protein
MYIDELQKPEGELYMTGGWIKKRERVRGERGGRMNLDELSSLRGYD